MTNQTSLPQAPTASYHPLLVRFLCVYLALYAFPFPLSAAVSIPLTLAAQVLSPLGIDLPMLAQIEQVFYQSSEMLAGLMTVPLGKLFGLTVQLQPTGSGDTTHHVLKTGLLIVTSILIAAIWNWRRKGTYPTTKARWGHVWGRWWLATCMMQYGFIKIFGQQFHVATSHELRQALGDYSPMHLAWTFLGHSPSYQGFAGLAELIPALLILNARTAILGLLMMLGVLSNVFAMNLFFDIPVKFASGHYLLATIILLVPYWPRIRAFLRGATELPAVDLYIKPKRFSEKTWSKLIFAAGLALVVSMFVGVNLRGQQMKQMRKPTPYAGRWDIQSTQRDAAPWTDTKSFKTLAIDDMGRFSLFNFEGEKTAFGLEPSPNEQTLVLRYPFRRQKDVKPRLENWSVALDQTTVQGPNHHPTGMKDRLLKVPVQADRITLRGRWQGHDYKVIAVRRPLPIEQPFRWIQEAPFQY